MFADDTFALKTGQNLEILINDLNSDINKMAIWFKANKLAVNKNKTKYMIFHVKGKKISNIPPVVYNENEPNLPFNPANVSTLERFHTLHENKNCRAYKLLGIYLDENLSLNFHIDNLKNKLNKSLYCIRAAKNNLNLKGLKSLYHALIHSHLSYCPSILGSTSSSNIKSLFKIQKKAIRIICNSKYNAHTAQLFLNHDILPLEKIIKRGKLLFMHSVFYDYAPISFKNVWEKNSEREGSIQLRNENHFVLPKPRIDLFKRSTLYSLPSEWNKSDTLMYYNNKFTFKLALEYQLFEEIKIENDLT